MRYTVTAAEKVILGILAVVLAALILVGSLE